jgi:hypothetical protein
MRLASEQAEQQEERKERASEAQVHRTGVLIDERSLQCVREVREHSQDKEDTVASKKELSRGQGTLLEARGNASKACATDNQPADCYKRGASNLKECV